MKDAITKDPFPTAENCYPLARQRIMEVRGEKDTDIHTVNVADQLLKEVIKYDNYCMS
jgi:hypothetical protein